MNTEERKRLVMAALAVADDLESRLYPAAGVIRQLAQVVATTPMRVSQSCPVCGKPVVVGATGRRRKYCDDKCKNRASRSRARHAVTVTHPVRRPTSQNDYSPAIAYPDPVGEEAVDNVLRGNS